MNKKVMAVAVAGALSAPVAAFAQASNVQIYGTMDVSVQTITHSANGNTFAATTAAGTAVANNSGRTMTDLYNQSSRFGLRGTEDLGNGLRAWFQAESNIHADGRQPNTTAGLGSRNTAVGLQGGWGNVSIGNWDSPYKSQLTGKLGPFGNGFGGHNGMLLGGGTDTTGTQPNVGCDNLAQASGQITSSLATGGGTTANTPTLCGQVEGSATSFHRRLSNVIQYWTPTINGFTGKIAYEGTGQKVTQTNAAGTNAATIATNTPTLWAMSLEYDAGPISASVAYERHVGFRAIGIGNTSTTAGQSTSNNAKDTGLLLTGAYNFGVARVMLAYERLSYGDTAPSLVAGGFGAAAQGSNNFKRNAWFLGVDGNVSANGRLYGGYSYTPGNKSCGNLGINAPILAAAAPGGSLNNAFFCGSDTGAKAYTIGYEHSLSKRTSLYANYMKVDNRQFAGFTPATPKANPQGTSAAVAVGTDQSIAGLGIKHSF